MNLYHFTSWSNLIRSLLTGYFFFIHYVLGVSYTADISTDTFASLLQCCCCKSSASKSTVIFPIRCSFTQSTWCLSDMQTVKKTCSLSMSPWLTLVLLKNKGKKKKLLFQVPRRNTVAEKICGNCSQIEFIEDEQCFKNAVYWSKTGYQSGCVYCHLISQCNSMNQGNP